MSHRLFCFYPGIFRVIIIVVGTRSSSIESCSNHPYIPLLFSGFLFFLVKIEILSLRDIVVLFLEFCFSGIMQKRERKKKAPTDPARRKYPCSNNHYNQHPLFSFWKWWWREFRLNHHYKYGGRNICRQCWFGFFG